MIEGAVHQLEVFGFRSCCSGVFSQGHHVDSCLRDEVLESAGVQSLVGMFIGRTGVAVDALETCIRNLGRRGLANQDRNGR